MFPFFEKPIKKQQPLSETEQIIQAQEEKIHLLDEQIAAKTAFKELLERNLKKVREM